MSQARILVVEDERIVAKDIERRLSGLGYAVAGYASTAKQAIEKAETEKPDMVLMDIRLHGNMDGIEAADIIRNKFDIPVVYLTAYGSDSIIERAKTTEPFGYVMKPFEDKELHVVIEIALFRHKMERKLKESEKRYRGIFEGSRDALFVLDHEGRITDFNSAFSSLFRYGHDEAKEKMFIQLSPCDDDKKVIAGAIADKGALIDREIELMTKTGESLHCLLTISTITDRGDPPVLCFQGSIHDITRRKQLESELHHAQKMEMVGTFASKVAHDFNNILTAILGYGKLIVLKVEENLTAVDYANKIMTLCDKATSFTQDLLTFSRKESAHMHMVEVNEIVEKAKNILGEVIGKKVTLKTELVREKLLLLADPGQIEQVIFNLVSNARDAMPEGGTITIATSRVSAGDDYLVKRVPEGSGDYACIEVKDDGCGIDTGIMERIFEPFFTTKEAGKGTGLGLAIVYGIVKLHKGFIRVASEVSEGTLIRIYLPLAGNQ